jgi:hypothetical protein
LAGSAGIELLFFKFAFGRLIISGASLLCALFTMGLAASEWTINIVSMGIARIGQKENFAVPALLHVWPKSGMLFNDAAQPAQILSRHLANAFFAIPVGLKLKKGLKSYDKKAKS